MRGPRQAAHGDEDVGGLDLIDGRPLEDLAGEVGACLARGLDYAGAELVRRVRLDRAVSQENPVTMAARWNSPP